MINTEAHKKTFDADTRFLTCFIRYENDLARSMEMIDEVTLTTIMIIFIKNIVFFM